jgi:hypothetical protein
MNDVEYLEFMACGPNGFGCGHVSERCAQSLTDAIRRVLAERAALIAAWPGGPCTGNVCPTYPSGSPLQRWVVMGTPHVYPTRESAVLAAAGIEREEA